jgi:hypothetical protein
MSESDAVLRDNELEGPRIVWGGGCKLRHSSFHPLPSPTLNCYKITFEEFVRLEDGNVPNARLKPGASPKESARHVLQGAS